MEIINQITKYVQKQNKDMYLLQVTEYNGDKRLVGWLVGWLVFMAYQTLQVIFMAYQTLLVS